MSIPRVILATAICAAGLFSLTGCITINAGGPAVPSVATPTWSDTDREACLSWGEVLKAGPVLDSSATLEEVNAALTDLGLGTRRSATLATNPELREAIDRFGRLTLAAVDDPDLTTSDVGDGEAAKAKAMNLCTEAFG